MRPRGGGGWFIGSRSVSNKDHRRRRAAAAGRVQRNREMARFRRSGRIAGDLSEVGAEVEARVKLLRRKVMNGKTLLLFAASLFSTSSMMANGQTPAVRSAIINSTTKQ